jgi:trehalose 6-phosphate synthase/phosphatase
MGHEHQVGQVSTGDRVVKVDAFPMGIDYERYANAAKRPDVQKEIKKIKKKLGNTKIILSVDRLDYTKGILQRLEAFDAFLRQYPEYAEKVTLILVAVPSRTAVETYAQLKQQVDEFVGRINGKHSTIGWNPVCYLYRSLPFHILAAYYHMADVALVTPVRDGMNLIAKEFIASKRDGRGVLILSEVAGAASEMGEALVVNPNKKEDVVEALRKALIMPDKEQRMHNAVMQKRLQRYNLVKWGNDFMQRLSQIKKVQEKLVGKRLTPTRREQLMKDYITGEKRLIFLDYDGTLVSFAKTPEGAKPDRKLLNLLTKIARPSQNKVVLISGRDRPTLDGWFGKFNVDLIAEHGVWLKEGQADWRTIQILKKVWKREIRPLLELFVDRTPGSLLEEKDFSLVWHYRQADPDLAAIRLMELKDALIDLTENLHLEIMDGNKVIEIKNAGINKGTAALRWIDRGWWDFIMAIGDDVTDENMFAIMPDRVHSIKVGLHPSRARFFLDSVKEVRDFLKELTKADN